MTHLCNNHVMTILMRVELDLQQCKSTQNKYYHHHKGKQILELVLSHIFIPKQFNEF